MSRRSILLGVTSNCEVPEGRVFASLSLDQNVLEVLKGRTQSDQLVMSLYGNGSDVVELRWICYLRHTDVELRTTEINSGDIDRWLAELVQDESPVPDILPSPCDSAP